MNYERKTKESLPVLAICYDFDKTLTPDNMQAQGYIQSVGYDVEQFWEETDKLAHEHGMDGNLAYMYKMVIEAEGNLVLNRKALMEYGAKVKVFPGVEQWFDRIREYGKENGVIVEHYIISSGLQEMIEGTEMAKNGAFDRIYASSFYFNDRGLVKWPAQVVNYTSKTCIIVLNIDSVPLGIIVDNVRSVLDIDLNEIHALPLKRPQKLANGMLKLDDDTVAMSFDCRALVDN